MKIRRQPKQDRSDKTGKGPSGRIRRARYADRPDPRPAKVIVDQTQGKVIGYELSSGRFVRADEQCCSNPFECRECWVPVRTPWWWR